MYKVLYDKKYINELPDIDKYENPKSLILCKQSDPSIKDLRNKIEKWYQNIPDAQRADIYHRLRSLKDEEHLSAFYEVLFHQYFYEEKWEIEMHPKIDGQTPDFYVKLQDGNDFYCEILVMLKNEKSKNEAKRLFGLLRKIDKINTEFNISVDLNKPLQENVNYDAIVNKIVVWIEKLKKTEKEHYKLEFNNFGFDGSISAIYYSAKLFKSGCVLSWMEGGSYALPIERIYSLIRKKANKYKFTRECGKPFVVVVCMEESFISGERAINQALYGNEKIVFEINNPGSEAHLIRNNRGMITPKPKNHGQTMNKRISAVISCERVWRDRKDLYNIRVFHNPWAVNKLPMKVFEKLPQFAEIESKPNFITLGWHNDNKQYVII